MCGIFAYINFYNKKTLSEILSTLLTGLRSLEYRGYDSCGVSFDTKDDDDRKIVVAKAKGTVDNLSKVVEKYMNDIEFNTHICIGHTRWATHGPATPVNAHPHFSSSNYEFVVVHNGIISNFAEIKCFLEKEGYGITSVPSDGQSFLVEQSEGQAEFYSETDTEVLSKLAHYIYNKLLNETGYKPTFLSVIANTIYLIKGTFGCIFKSSYYPNEAVAARLASPLLFGFKYHEGAKVRHSVRSVIMNRDGSFTQIDKLAEDLASSELPTELFIASDAPAFADKTKDVLVLQDWDIVHISESGIDIVNFDNVGSDHRTIEKIDVSLQSIALGDYPHFMLKEIKEQPITLHSTLLGRLCIPENCVKLGGIIPHLDTIRKSKYITFIGCGTSYNAALAVRPLFEQFTKQRIYVEVASDFNDRLPAIFRDDICVFLSQSGETADTLLSLEHCRRNEAFCIGINNTPGSSITRNTDCGIHINAGVEIGVASTKCYTSMVVCLILFLILLLEDTVSMQDEIKRVIKDLSVISDLVSETIKKTEDKVKELADIVAKKDNLIMLGRRTHYATARETALKIKELTYIHSEGLMAGELKHGPLALIDEHSLVIFFATGENDEMFAACQSSLQQVKARGARVLVIASEEEEPKVKDISDWIVIVPKTSQWLQTIINIIPMQLLSYYTAIKKGINVDRPRNLAKSVTVQ